MLRLKQGERDQIVAQYYYEHFDRGKQQTVQHFELMGLKVDEMKVAHGLDIVMDHEVYFGPMAMSFPGTEIFIRMKKALHPQV
jgi:hypothetical protein